MNTNITVVGGGLAGLAVATLLARGGKKVRLLERAELGGRARTSNENGTLFNLGPHALYRAGAARRVLRTLGIEPKGAIPPASGALAWHGGQLHALPAGAVSLLSTSLFTLPEKLEYGRLLARANQLEALGDETLEHWLARELSSPRVRDAVRAIFRVSTYCNQPTLPARNAIANLKLALAKNVLYLDGGWQTLVDAAVAKAREAGVEILENHPVHALPEGEVVLAVPPREAAELVPELDISRLTPVRAACLDLALDALPAPRRGFALGIDQPLYFSVHSNTVKLGAHHAVHLAKYLGPSDVGADALPELEALADAMQPGWREHMKARRFMPELCVMHAVPGFRLPVEVPRVSSPESRVFLVGDWVGEEGMLLDAALSSAEDVARRILSAGARAAA
jgi:hypothetical protein